MEIKKIDEMERWKLATNLNVLIVNGVHFDMS